MSRRIELNRQQQFRATLLAHQAKGDDLPPGTPGPRPKGKAKAKGKGVAALTVVTPRAAANVPPVGSLVLRPVPVIHFGVRVRAQEAKIASTSISELLIPRRRLRARLEQNPRQDRDPEASVPQGRGNRRVDFSPPVLVSGVTSAPLSTVALMPPLHLPRRRPSLRPSVKLRPKPRLNPQPEPL